MARIRTIKPEFWSDEQLCSLPEATHLLAAALLNYADDDGYFKANPALVKAACCPIREPSVSIQESLRQLSEIGFLRLGSDGKGRRYGHVVNFLVHQKVSHPTPSKISSCVTLWEESVRPHGSLPNVSALNGIELNGIESISSEPCEQASEQEDSILEFPTVGKGAKNWHLTQSLLDEFVDSYPGLPVMEEMRRAKTWCVTNATKRKTPKGMPKFLNNWLTRRTDGGTGRGDNTTQKTPAQRLAEMAKR